jgi:hypothetical protein
MERECEVMTKARLFAFVTAFGLFLFVLFRAEPGFIPLLDHANLLFHEAGHPIIGLCSSRLEPYGGTVGQVAFPVVLAVSFWRQGSRLGLAAAAIWFFENWLNIARYMADARVQELPLVGGGDHDWNTIFGRWGGLQYDTRIAAVVRTGAWLGMAAVCVCVLWCGWRDRSRRTDQSQLASEPIT